MALDIFDLFQALDNYIIGKVSAIYYRQHKV